MRVSTNLIPIKTPPQWEAAFRHDPLWKPPVASDKVLQTCGDNLLQRVQTSQLQQAFMCVCEKTRVLDTPATKTIVRELMPR